MKSYRYLMPTEVVFAPGSLNQLGERCGLLGMRPLVVTGKRSARATGFLDRVMGLLPNAALFDDVEENPSTATCDRGAELCRARHCDVIVALGGGSPMDTAKAIAILARNPGVCDQYFGAEKYGQGSLPIVAVPTTAGTGSEVTPYAVITDPALAMKRTISGRSLFPRVALLDPELTLSLPRHVTVHTGLDALSQAMEGMISRTSTAVGDALALEACRLIRTWLPTCVRDGGDVEARGHMLHASMLAGCVIAQSGTTLVHGMGYYYTMRYGVPHGLANALLLTPLFRFNATVEPEKVAAIATALGHPCAPSAESACAGIAQALHALLAEVGVSPSARDAGVGCDALRTFAEEVAGDPYRLRNQPGSITADDVYAWFEQSYLGVGD